jgi:hypothetical protein
VQSSMRNGVIAVTPHNVRAASHLYYRAWEVKDYGSSLSTDDNAHTKFCKNTCRCFTIMKFVLTDLKCSYVNSNAIILLTFVQNKCKCQRHTTNCCNLCYVSPFFTLHIDITANSLVLCS